MSDKERKTRANGGPEDPQATRLDEVSLEVSLMLKEKGISLEPGKREQELVGNSGTYVVDVNVESTQRMSIGFTGLGEYWKVSFAPVGSGYSYVYYSRSKDNKVVEFGSYGMGETEKQMRRSNPDLESVDVFEKFDGLLQDFPA